MSDKEIAIKAKITPGKIDLNLAAVKKEVEAQVAKYNIVVTEDSVKGAKTVATKLNKVAESIDTKRKEIIQEASKYINEADVSMKEIVTICKEGRQKIVDQVKVFEDKERDRIKDILQECLDDLYDDYKVNDEFRLTKVDGFVKLTAITGTSAVVASTLREMTNEVRSNRALQDRTDMRLSQLESQCFRAGLDSPLTKAHVGGVLLSDDEVYNAEVQRLIEAEIDRKAEAEVIKEEQAKATTTSKKKFKAPAKAKAGRKSWYVAATFNIETSDSMTADEIEENLRSKLIAAGVKVKVDIVVEEV